MALGLSDLVGKLTTVEIIGMSQAEKDGKSIVVLKLRDANGEHEVGLFGNDTATKILELHGRKDGEKLLLDIPITKIRAKAQGIEWINHPY